jgi:hypothetical protein
VLEKANLIKFHEKEMVKSRVQVYQNTAIFLELTKTK